MKPSADFQVRPATLADARPIVELLGELGYPDNEVEAVQRRLEEWAAEAGSAVLVADRGGELLGLVAVTLIRYFEREGSLGRIVALVVAATARGEGVGRRLVGEAELIARNHGCVAMEVSSARSRTDAHGFYSGLGYLDKGDVATRFTRDLIPGASARTYAARFPSAGGSPTPGP